MQSVQDISSWRPVLWKVLWHAGGGEQMGWLCPSLPSMDPSWLWLCKEFSSQRDSLEHTEIWGFGAAEPLSNGAWRGFAVSLWHGTQKCPFHNSFSFREKIPSAGSVCSVAAAHTCVVNPSCVLWAGKHMEIISRGVTSVETKRLSTQPLRVQANRALPVCFFFFLVANRKDFHKSIKVGDEIL